MKKVMPLWICMLILTFTGCGYLQGYFQMIKEQGVSEEYQRSLREWTREMTAHSQFETKFYISATYRSLAFNEAFLREQVRVRQWSEARVKEREEAWIQTHSAYREFLVYAYTDNMEANDLDRQGSLWSVFLREGTGKRYEPLEIRRVERITPEIEAFFPFVNKYYGRCYIVKFPAGETNIDQHLVFSSVLGKVDLVWQAGGHTPVAPSR